MTLEDVEMDVAGEWIYKGLAERGGKESSVFSPLNQVIWGPQKVKVRLVLIENRTFSLSTGDVSVSCLYV